MPVDPIYFEMDQYPKESRDAERGYSAERLLNCEWVDRYALFAALMNHPGQLYPYNEALGIRARRCTIAGFGGGRKRPGFPTMNTYQRALLSVIYENPKLGEKTPYPISRSRAKFLDPTKSISERFEGNVQTQRLDHTDFKWSNGDPLKPDEAPFKLVQGATYVMTRHQLSVVPAQALSYQGTVNDDAISPILWSGITFAAGTLLFSKPTIDVEVGDDGTPRYAVTYRFDYRASGWNQFWRAATEDYETIEAIGVTYDPGEFYMNYPEADFSVLFP